MAKALIPSTSIKFKEYLLFLKKFFVLFFFFFGLVDCVFQLPFSPFIILSTDKAFLAFWKNLIFLSLWFCLPFFVFLQIFLTTVGCKTEILKFYIHLTLCLENITSSEEYFKGMWFIFINRCHFLFSNFPKLIKKNKSTQLIVILTIKKTIHNKYSIT